jgi:hypothetical protein
MMRVCVCVCVVCVCVCVWVDVWCVVCVCVVCVVCVCGVCDVCVCVCVFFDPILLKITNVCSLFLSHDLPLLWVYTKTHETPALFVCDL